LLAVRKGVVVVVDGDDDDDDDCDADAGAYFCMNMMLITLSSFLAVVVISAHIRGDRRNRVPRWLKAVRYLLLLSRKLTKNL